MTNDIQVRKVALEDKKHTPTAYQVINAAFRSPDSWTTDRAIVAVDRITPEGIDQLVENSGRSDVFLYAFDKETMIGCILIKPEVDGEGAILSMLAVSPSHQSRGIGGLLIRESLQYIQHNMTHIKQAIVHVFQCRPELLIWYKGLGFIDAGELIPFPEKSILLVQEAPLVVLRYFFI
jgi:ribosomal protein S18 acetylase RimI-like enzyme